MLYFGRPSGMEATGLEPATQAFAEPRCEPAAPFRLGHSFIPPDIPRKLFLTDWPLIDDFRL
jgi:hypothetical protein